MLTKCTSCFRALGWKIMGHSVPKWQIHIQAFCSARVQKQPWCEMFLDNFELICEHLLPREVQRHIRNTNIASEIVAIITKHYQQESNLFRFCIELFGSYLKLKYSQTINPSKNTLTRIATEHQDFNKLLINLFVLYFQLQDRQIVGEQTFYKSTLPSLANHLAFDNIDVNTTINQTAKSALKGHIDKLQFQTQKFSSYSIGEYGLKDEIQLNQKTLQMFNVKNGKVDERLYSGAIQIIKEIVRVNSPAEKMRLIEGLSRQIQSSVHQFYKKHSIKMQKIDISNQQLTTILIYLLVQANISVFYAHLQIAIMFSPPSSRAVSIIDALLKGCQTLENGSINYREYPALFSEPSQTNLRKGSGGPVFFDEVTSLDL